jgi:hypothetical protein
MNTHTDAIDVELAAIEALLETPALEADAGTFAFAYRY